MAKNKCDRKNDQKKKQPPKNITLSKKELYDRNIKIYKEFLSEKASSNLKSAQIIENVAKKFNLSFHFVRGVIYFRSKWMTPEDLKKSNS
jgi:hypothetical protein